MILRIDLGRAWCPRIGLTDQALAAKAQEEASRGEAVQVIRQEAIFGTNKISCNIGQVPIHPDAVFA